MTGKPNEYTEMNRFIVRNEQTICELNCRKSAFEVQIRGENLDTTSNLWSKSLNMVNHFKRIK